MLDFGFQVLGLGMLNGKTSEKNPNKVGFEMGPEKQIIFKRSMESKERVPERRIP